LKRSDFLPLYTPLAPPETSELGDPSAWPGDTTDISTLSSDRVVLSWGRAPATTGKQSQIWAAPVTIQLH
jgi:hypothetical protein